MGFNKIGLMKFFIAMVCGLVLAGCPTDSDDNNKINYPDSKVVETRLRGSWHIATSVGQTPTSVVYEFGERTYKYNNTTMNVYTRGDAIYDTLTDSIVMYYQILSEDWFDLDYAEAEQTHDNGLIYRWGIWKKGAQEGRAIRFGIMEGGSSQFTHVYCIKDADNPQNLPEKKVIAEEVRGNWSTSGQSGIGGSYNFVFSENTISFTSGNVDVYNPLNYQDPYSKEEEGGGIVIYGSYDTKQFIIYLNGVCTYDDYSISPSHEEEHEMKSEYSVLQINSWACIRTYISDEIGHTHFHVHRLKDRD